MSSVFRKTAIERLSSPDRLDSMLKITSPMSWIGIGAAAVLAAVVAGWSFTGSIPTTVSVPGVLTHSYHTNSLHSSASGTVTSIYVSEGEAVSEGTPVLEVHGSADTWVTVCSTQEGIVSGQFVKAGDTVYPGDEVFRLSPVTENALSLVCYVDSATAKQLENGMETTVFLDAADAGTVGYMKAAVTNIDEYRASDAAILEVLGTGSELSDLVRQAGSVFAVTCELQADEASENGYYFSGPQGSLYPVGAGETASVQIVLDECAPITKVFPMFGGN